MTKAVTTASKAENTPPQIPKVVSENIPDLLKDLNQWIVWEAGPFKDNGRFDKWPINPVTGGRLTGWNAPDKWLTYQAALAFHDRGKGDGIGIVLRPEHKVTVDGKEYCLVALDFDACAKDINKIKELWLRLGMPYVEGSPSGKGLGCSP